MFWRRSDEPPRHLPLPSGPHAVGYQDVMTPGPPEEGKYTYKYGLFYGNGLKGGKE